MALKKEVTFKNRALADALYRTTSGAGLAMESKRFVIKKAIAKNIREASDLFYASWVKTCPEGADKAFRIQVFHDLKPRLKTVCIKAALKKKGYPEEYNHILTAFKFMDFPDAISRIEKYPPVERAK